MDYIPALDTPSPNDDSLIQHINALIDAQLAKTDTTTLHPSLTPLQHTDTTLLPISEHGITPHMSNDLASKYTHTSTTDGLKLLSSHSQLRLIRNSTISQIATANSNTLDNLLILESKSLDTEKENLQSLLSQKRKALEDLSNDRKRQVKDFKPINDFLHNRYNEKINELIQLQIQLEE